MSDEEDYMSEDFLAKISHIRPSSIQDQRKRRLLDVELKNLESSKKSKKEFETPNDRLQASLKKILGGDNRGFKLLTKMGYKPGQALGKQENITKDDKTKSTALTEPISVIIKDDRSGLGRETALRDLKNDRRQLTQKRLLEQLDTGEFRKRSTARAKERFDGSALKKCQITCENLDRAANVSQPAIVWFWSECLPESQTTCEKSSNEEETEIEMEYSLVDKLEMLTKYLRTAYLFCFWCGIKYEDLKDLNESCPGLKRDDH